MSFFEPLPEPEPSPNLIAYRPPSWLEPPFNERPVAVTLAVVFAQTPDAAVHIVGASVFSTGLSFEVTCVFRTSRAGRDLPLDDVGSEDGARFGVAFADGRRAQLNWSLGERAPDISLVSHGGSGSSHRSTSGMWLWPIPPEGPLTFAFRWLAEGMETLVDVDSGSLREAAARVVELWPDQRPEPPRRDPGDPGWSAYAPG